MLVASAKCERAFRATWRGPKRIQTPVHREISWPQIWVANQWMTLETRWPRSTCDCAMPFLAWPLSEGHLLESRLLATVVAEADALNQTPRSPPVPHPYLKLPGP